MGTKEQCFRGKNIVNGFTLFLIILTVTLAIVAFLYFFGRRMQKRQELQDEQVATSSQQVSMFIIDKKKIRLKDAGLPEAVVNQTPKILRRSKVPVLKAKVGPQVMNLICENSIFDDVPVKKEVKATVTGIYVTAVKGLHGKPVVTEPKKKSRFARFVEKLQEKGGAAPVK